MGLCILKPMEIYQLNTYKKVNLRCQIYLTVEFQYLHQYCEKRNASIQHKTGFSLL